jgi:hypothetical protein
MFNRTVKAVKEKRVEDGSIERVIKEMNTVQVLYAHVWKYNKSIIWLKTTTEKREKKKTDEL